MKLIETLQELTEPKTFHRGLAILASGKVLVNHQSNERVSAKVLGTKPYSVVLSNEDGFFASCNCPAAEYQLVCKHAVATAMMVWADRDLSEAVAQPAGGASDTANKGNKGNKDSKVDESRSALYRWLENKEPAELVDIALRLIESDSETYDIWMQKMQMSQSSLSAKELKKRITKALPKRNIWEPARVERYFDKALASLEVIKEGMAKLSADEQWPLLEYAETRLETVQEQIDDSYGYRFALENDLREFQIQCFTELTWSDVEKGKWLFERYNADHSLLDIPDNVDFDEAAVNQFYSHCEAALMAEGQSDSHSWHFARPLLDKARRDNNWKQESYWLTRVATTTKDWLNLCRLHLAHDDEFIAEDCLIKAKRLATDGADQNACLRHEIDVRIALEQDDDAWQCAKSWFLDTPFMNVFTELKRYQAKLAPDEAIDAWCEAQMQASFAAQTIAFNKRHQSESLVKFYIYQQQLEKAMQQANLVLIEESLLLSLCHQVLTTEPDWAFNRYYKVLALHIEQTNNRAYQDANIILDEIEHHCESVDQQTLFDQLIQQLRTDFKAKRNMMALLAARRR